MITSINIFQSNTLPGCELLSVHNPLVFLADVTYSAELPETLLVDLEFDGDVLGTFNCLPFKDVSGTVRRFAFVADQIIRGVMDSFEDFESAEGVLEYVPGITKQLKARFYIGEVSTYVDFTACHAARQYGENPAMDGINHNATETTYYAAATMPVYVYFYNNDETNVITVGTGALIFEKLIDFDDVALLDFDSQYLTSL